VSASTVAVVIGALAAEPWMPRISHWEIATTDEVWGAHAELDCKTSGPAFRELHALADKVGSEVTAVSDSLSAVDFVHDDVPVRVWWLRPGCGGSCRRPARRARRSSAASRARGSCGWVRATVRRR
jgi:hypothetical protein